VKTLTFTLTFTKLNNCATSVTQFGNPKALNAHSIPLQDKKTHTNQHIPHIFNQYLIFYFTSLGVLFVLKSV